MKYAPKRFREAASAKQHNQASAIPSSHAFRVASAQPVGKRKRTAANVFRCMACIRMGVLVSTLRYVKTTLCLSLTRSATVPEHWLNVSPLVHMPFVGQRSRLNKTYWWLALGQSVWLPRPSPGLKGRMLLLLILIVNVASTLWIIWQLMSSTQHRKVLLPRLVKYLAANWLA